MANALYCRSWIFCMEDDEPNEPKHSELYWLAIFDAEKTELSSAEIINKLCRSAVFSAKLAEEIW